MEKHNYEIFSAALNQCDKELDEIYHKYALTHHLSDAALWILYALYESRESITQANICNLWSFSRQTINTALKNLEQKKIIELVSIPNNKKSKQILFTSEGIHIAEEILKPLLSAEQHVFATFTEEENKLFIELCQKRCTLLRDFLETK